MAAEASVDALLAAAEQLPVEGWDLSVLGDRIRVEGPQWDFAAIVAEHARTAPSLLDLGTGGGEWLASLAVRPDRTVATEGWPPNVGIARRRLRPLGITVVETEAVPDNVDQRPDDPRGQLPFPDRSFGLVTSRHEAFVACEVARVLAPGGRFLTQQLGGDYGDFHEALDLPRPSPPGRRWTLRLAARQLAAAGLEVVDSGEGVETTVFADVGALAWYLRLIPWTIEDFSIRTHRARVERLHRRLAGGPLRTRLPAFWLEAVKPAESPSPYQPA